MRRKPVIVPLPSASGVLSSEAGCIVWMCTRETTGTTAALFRLWDASRPSGIQLMTISLLANQSTREWIHPHVLPFTQGLYYQVLSGSLEGSVSVILGVHDCGLSVEMPYEPTMVEVEPGIVEQIPTRVLLGRG